MNDTETVPVEAVVEFFQVLRNDDRLYELEGERNASRRQRIITELGAPIASSYGITVKELAFATARMMDRPATYGMR